MGIKGRTVLAVMVLLLGSCLNPAESIGGPTRVGNGDDGSDLEGLKKISDGPIFESRKKAVRLLSKLNTSGIKGLSALIPEVANSSLYFSNKQVKSKIKLDSSTFHANMQGSVYARTFARPYSPTRFFPASEKLSEDQLVALHIHEALHRSLPKKIRMKEDVVSEITLAIATPESTHDGITEVVERVFDEYSLNRKLKRSGRLVEVGPDELGYENAGENIGEIYTGVEVSERFKVPSEFSYSFQSFNETNRLTLHEAKSLHRIKSFLYPFGTERLPLGLGIEGSFISRTSGSSTGPLGLSARMKFWTFKGFDVSGCLTHSMNTLSNDELVNSPLGRDVTTFGISMFKESESYYIGNAISASPGSDAKEDFGPVELTYTFGNSYKAEVETGFIYKRLRVGGFIDYSLMNNWSFEQTGGNGKVEIGRFRIISGGPKIGYHLRNLSFEVHGKFIIDATKNRSLDYLGDILGQGASQGYVGASLSIFI